jgi:hypothetical protein
MLHLKYNPHFIHFGHSISTHISNISIYRHISAISAHTTTVTNIPWSGSGECSGDRRGDGEGRASGATGEENGEGGGEACSVVGEICSDDGEGACSSDRREDGEGEGLGCDRRGEQ